VSSGDTRAAQRNLEYLCPGPVLYLGSLGLGEQGQP
jgi:hypothetical protein